jgi:hypothetical protein
MIHVLHLAFFMLQSQGERGGQGICHVWEKPVRFFPRKKIKRDLLANLGMNGKVILKWTIKH